MPPTKWDPERNEALLVAFGIYLVTNARPKQQMEIEEFMKDHGYPTCTWEGISCSRLASFFWPCECLTERARLFSTVFNQVPSLVQSCSVRTAAVQTASVQTGSVQTGSVQTGSIQYGSVQIRFVLTDSIQYGPVRPYPTTYLTVRNVPVQSHFTTSSTVTNVFVRPL
ncbi:hypothetical protein PG984_006577 [Apiospora sp. TS-2023a]